MIARNLKQAKRLRSGLLLAQRWLAGFETITRFQVVQHLAWREGSLILTEAPKEFLGRISSVQASLSSASAIVGATLASYLDSTSLSSFHIAVLGTVFGPVDTIFTIAGLLTLIGGIYALVNLGKQKPIVESPLPQVAEAES